MENHNCNEFVYCQNYRHLNTNKLIKTTHNKQSPIDTKAQVTESDYDAGSGTKKSQGLGKISDY